MSYAIPNPLFCCLERIKDSYAHACPSDRPLPTGNKAFAISKPLKQSRQLSFASISLSAYLSSPAIAELSCLLRCQNQWLTFALSVFRFVSLMLRSCLAYSARHHLQRSTDLQPVAHLVWLAFAYATGFEAFTLFESGHTVN
jgi:hypothetical protein